MRNFYPNLISHEETFVVLGHTLMSSLFGVKFNEAVSDLEFDVGDVANFPEAALQILPASRLR